MMPGWSGGARNGGRRIRRKKRFRRGRRRWHNEILDEHFLLGLPGLLSELNALMAEFFAHSKSRLRGYLPGFQPAFIADAIAQGQHRIHMGALPSHPGTFQACFNHEFVGTLHHSRTDRPACAPIGGVLHLAEPFAKIPQMFANRFLRGFRLCQAICHRSQGHRTTMFQDMEASVEHASRKHATTRAQCLQQAAQVFSRMRKVQNPDCILPMDVHEG